MANEKSSGNGPIVDGIASVFGTLKRVMSGEKKLEELGEEACQDQSGIDDENEAKTNPPPANVRRLEVVKP